MNRVCISIKTKLIDALTTCSFKRYFLLYTLGLTQFQSDFFTFTKYTFHIDCLITYEKVNGMFICVKGLLETQEATGTANHTKKVHQPNRFYQQC